MREAELEQLGIERRLSRAVVAAARFAHGDGDARVIEHHDHAEVVHELCIGTRVDIDAGAQVDKAALLLLREDLGPRDEALCLRVDLVEFHGRVLDERARVDEGTRDLLDGRARSVDQCRALIRADTVDDDRLRRCRRTQQAKRRHGQQAALDKSLESLHFFLRSLILS